jgi:hypothetical protein
MSIAYATIYGYIAFAAAGSLVFHTLCLRGFRRAEAERRQVRTLATRELKHAA